jgi:hypothetical protein
MTYYYEIAGYCFSFNTTNKSIVNIFEPFLVNKPETIDFAIELIPQREIPVPDGSIVSREKSIVWIKKHDGGFFAYMEDPNGNPCVAVDSDYLWTRCTVLYQDNLVSADPSINLSNVLALQFVGMAFRNHITFKNGIVLHASCIDYQGRGIAFTAPSGTGKSTHVMLWEKYKKDTKVINDDAPIIRIINGKPFVYGSPWSGSNYKFMNMCAPLTSIVLLEQSTENSIRPLGISEAVILIMPRVLLPYHDNKMMEMAVTTFEQVISTVPVYNLKCRPDAEAVEKAYQCIMS